MLILNLKKECETVNNEVILYPLYLGYGDLFININLVLNLDGIPLGLEINNEYDLKYYERIFEECPLDFVNKFYYDSLYETLKESISVTADKILEEDFHIWKKGSSSDIFHIWFDKNYHGSYYHLEETFY